MAFAHFSIASPIYKQRFLSSFWLHNSHQEVQGRRMQSIIYVGHAVEWKKEERKKSTKTRAIGKSARIARKTKDNNNVEKESIA